MKKRTKKRLSIILIVLIALVFFVYIQNNSIVTTKITISSAKIPASFMGYKIVQLSDLHNKTFGNNQRKLVKKVNKANPNLIVFTGDLVDSRNYDEQPSLILMEQLVQIAPVYYVTGNHEWWSGKFSSLESMLLDIGVHVMRNTADTIAIGDDKIQIIGIDDPAHLRNSYAEYDTTEDAILNSLDGLEVGHQFNILLSHRPELLTLYAQYNFDLVFSGHAHGGQFRIPLFGGLVAPNQGFFPKYTSGAHTLDQTTMIVNKGLGNSIIPIRIFNRPEVVVVKLASSNN